MRESPFRPGKRISWQFKVDDENKNKVENRRLNFCFIFTIALKIMILLSGLASAQAAWAFHFLS